MVAEMGEMRQQGVRCRDLASHRHCFADTHVRRMRLWTQAVEHHGICPPREGDCVWRDGFTVGIINELRVAAALGEHEAERVDFAVRQKRGLDRALRQIQQRR